MAERGGLVHVWSTSHRSRAVHSGLQRSPVVHRSPRSQVPSWGNEPVGRTLIRMRSQAQGRQQPSLCLALEDPAGRPRRRRRAAVAPRCDVERWPLRRHRQGCRRSSTPREIRRVAGRLRMARTGFPPTPGSRRRGSVGARPKYGGRAACPPVPSDSPSLETHKEARRPGLSGGTSARLAVAPCAPFLPTIPHMGDNLRPSETNAIQRSTQQASRRVTACERLDCDTRAMNDGVFAG